MHYEMKWKRILKLIIQWMLILYQVIFVCQTFSVAEP